MRKLCLGLLLLPALLTLCFAQNPFIPPLPYSVPDEQILSLRQLVNPTLQRRLEKELYRNHTWLRLIATKKMAVGLVDITNPYNVKFARVNGDEMMYAASLPKLAILLAACQSLEDGALRETADVITDMRIMISRSDNPAATRMMERVGFAKIVSVLTNPQYDLYDPELGGLWVGKKYAKKSERYPDPLNGLSHGATVTQVCRFYYLLAMGKLINPHRSKQMLDILCNPELHHKFVNTLDAIAPEAKIFRKSGTWRIWHSDSALVWDAEWRRYIVAALVEDPHGEQILRELIPAVEEVLKSQSELLSRKRRAEVRQQNSAGDQLLFNPAQAEEGHQN
jgi:beta-lactamase class A